MYRGALPLLLAGAGSASAALQVDFGSSSSIKAAAKDVAFDAMTYYKGNQSGEIPGLLASPGPHSEYYPWTGAILWSTMIDYWCYTDDDAYNRVAVEGMVHQNGEGQGDRLAHPFMPANWSASLANDDQGFWGMAAMQAAESGFPEAPQDWDQPRWIELAQAVFETQARRFDAEEGNEKACNGGLRWVVAPLSAGYNYKNSVSNAVFLNLAARLARYTGNQTYADWASRTWDWLAAVGFIDADFRVFDGAHVEKNCTDINRAQFSYVPGVLLQAAAYLYNQTSDDNNSNSNKKIWQSRLEGLTNATLTHFSSSPSSSGILVERACEARGTCTTDMLFFKGILFRSLASAVRLAPFLHGAALPALRANAEAAVKACASGGPNGRECGFRWTTTTTDGDDDDKKGPPAELNALSALLGMLVDEAAGKAMLTNATAGTAAYSKSGSGSSGKGSGGDDDTGTGTGKTGSTASSTDSGKSAGSATRAALGLVLAGVVAALMS
ncbi:glycosyl hydrolase family 76-domain-containing protein [Chaetomium strumarium]|uniref:Mannan endo-1,6-alpha-mannosidase n=1 Tax=Chaetomium strumarium TaxID=1170767 RepID=A0AAJ0GV93_9PEZI|nr:glycosyl hydrolase family 76-domain-containing protein [Chaetomium strumarium]